LLIFEGKERGDLDPQSHQSISSLSEGNSWDLDLGEFGVLLVFFLSYSTISFCSFVGIWERRI
jgi:hypothetical protein